MQQKVHINDILTTLELPMDSCKLMSARSPEEAKGILIEFKALVKKQHRILVKKYHPDLPVNGDKEEEKIKQINAMIDVVNNLKIHRVPPKPQRVTVRFYRSTGFASSGSSTSSNFYSF